MPPPGGDLRQHGVRSLNRKLLAVLTVAAMVLVCLAVAASSEDTVAAPGTAASSVTIYSPADYEAILTNGSPTSEDDNWSASFADGVLTITDDRVNAIYVLDSVQISAGKRANLYALGDLTIVLKGSATQLMFLCSDNEIAEFYNIYVDGNLRIVNDSTSSADRELLLKAWQGSGSGLLGAQKESAGIYCTGSLELINNSSRGFTVTAVGSPNDYDESYCKNSTSGFRTYGVHAERGITVGSNVVLDATGGDISLSSRQGVTHSIGVFSGSRGGEGTLVGADITVQSGGKIVANGGSVVNSANSTSTNAPVYATISAGIYCRNLTVNGPDPDTLAVEAHGANLTAIIPSTIGGGGSSYGIRAEQLLINGGKVVSDGGSIDLTYSLNERNSYGVYALSGIEVASDGKLIASGNETNGRSFGIHVESNSPTALNVRGGYVEASSGFIGYSGYEDIGSYGIRVNGGITCDGGTVSGTAGVTVSSAAANAGIFARTVNLSGGAVVTGTGGLSCSKYTGTYYDISVGAAKYSVGVRLTGDAHIISGSGTELIGIGGQLTSLDTSGGNDGITCGIWLSNSGSAITVSGNGKITATGGDTKYNPNYGSNQSNLESIGLYSEDALTISGTVVEAHGGTVCTSNNSYVSYNGSISTGVYTASALSLTDGASLLAVGGANANASYSVDSKHPYYNDSYGLHVVGALSVSGSVLIAEAGKASRMAGIWAEGSISVSGDSSRVEAFADKNIRVGKVYSNTNIGWSDATYGIYMGGTSDDADITVTGGTLTSGGHYSLGTKPGSNTLSAPHMYVNGNYRNTPVSFSSVSGGTLIASSVRFTVSFEGSPSDGSMANLADKLGYITLPKNGFTVPKGFEFDGWLLDGTAYAPGDRYFVDSDVTFQAKWVTHVHSAVHRDAVKATCTTSGNIDHWYCPKCGCCYSDAALSNEIAAAEVNIFALGHDLYTVVLTAQTCTGAGESETRCHRCDYVKAFQTSALCHALAPHSAQAATCTETGWNEYQTCITLGCGYSTYVEIPALGHDWWTVTPRPPPARIRDGTHTRTVPDATTPPRS